MLHLRAALESSTCHGLPRTVTSKPIYVRLCWLAVFFVTLSLFLRGFVEFVAKLQANPATSSQDINAVDFRFPDVYTCFENPISGSYSANVDAASAAAINEQLMMASYLLDQFDKAVYGNASGSFYRMFSFLQPHSLQYQLLVDTLAQRLEQSILAGGIIYKDAAGIPHYDSVSLATFYHPVHLRCAKWSLDSLQTAKLKNGGSSSGLLLKVLLDTNSSFIPQRGAKIFESVYTQHSLIPVSEWPLATQDILSTDRATGLRVYLAPPGEYPSDFGTSFALGPGKFHTVEIGMTEQVYKTGQFDCLSDTPAVQFVNPYDQTPYNYSYNYAYCFFYNYQQQYQAGLNVSGDKTPMPWALRGKNYMFNLSSFPNMLSFIADPAISTSTADVQQVATATCDSRRPCTTLEYSVAVSSSDWIAESSLTPFINSTVAQAWMLAHQKNLSVPALDFLMTGNTSSVSAYVRNNLLKVFFKARRLKNDRVTFSRDYGASNFISDVGGIMGIYLGMSLLTLCEILELIYDLLSHAHSRRKKNRPAVVSVTPAEPEKGSG